MIDWDKPIETVEGWPAKVISATYHINHEPFFVVQIECGNGGWSRIVILDKDGRVRQGVNSTKIRNLLVKREGWMAVYRDKLREGVRDSSPLYDTLEECMKICGANKVAAYAKVEWEEYP